MPQASVAQELAMHLRTLESLTGLIYWRRLVVQRFATPVAPHEFDAEGICMTQKGRARALVWLLIVILPLFVVGAVIFASDPYPVSANTPGTCDPTRPHPSGGSNEMINTSEGTREYRLHVPPSYTGSDAVPLILNFHGFGSNSQDQEDYSQLATRADQPDGGFILVSPQGVEGVLGSEHWNNLLLASPEPDDVGFVDELLDALEAALCIDSTRVFSTGMSNGANMSVRLACSLSGRIAAIAPVAGSYFPPLTTNLPTEPCPDTRAVPLIAFHGTDDTTIPFDGGIGFLGLVFRLPIDNNTPDDDVMQSWAAHNGCSAPRQEMPVTAEVRFISYGSCTDNAVVQLYSVDGGGHTWPDAQDTPSLGTTTHDINATDLMWEFFQAHPLEVKPVGGISNSDGLKPLPAQRTSLVSNEIGAFWWFAGLAVTIVAAAGLLRYWTYRARERP